MTTSSVCGCHSTWVSFRLENLSQFPCFISLHVWVFCVGIEAITKHLGCFSCPAWTRFHAVSLVLYCVVLSFLWFLFSLLTFMSWPYLSCWIVPSHLLVTPHCPDLSAMCLIRLFLWKVKDLRQSVVSCWMSAISLASIQPVHLLSHRLKCWWCFYKPPWVHCSLKHWKGDLSPLIFLHHLWATRGFFLVFISIFDIHTIVLVWISAMYTPQQSQLSSLKPGFWANLTLKFFLLCLRLFPLWQEWGREKRKRHALEKAFWYFVMC